MKPENVTLTLLLTRGVPMQVWHQTGILNREIKYYLNLSRRFKKIIFITYGRKSEINLFPSAENITILCNKWNLPPNLYSLLIPFLYRKEINNVDIIKTNQLDGAWTAIIAGWVYKKPVIVRAGYVWSDVYSKEIGKDFKAALIKIIERWCLKKCHHIFSTTQEIKERLIEKYHLPVEKITVIPNYIDTSIFHPNSEIQKIPGRICFVGRLAPIKNIDILIRAISQIPNAFLIIIGKGKQEEELRSLAKQLQANVQFLGQMENEDLPGELLKSEIFVLPSALEGHPKALIEAMACGCAVIGTDVPGIRTIIRHKETGYLCNPTVESLRDAIIELLNNEVLRKNISENAATYAQHEFNIDRIVDLETKAILDCLSHEKSKPGSS